VYDDPASPAAKQPPVQDRRSGDDRRAAPLGRRAEDRRVPVRTIVATLLAFSGALVVMYLFFAAIGAVNLEDAGIFTVVALVLTIIWLVGVYQRARSGALFVQRPDRERRGF
jgi:hypothetical protein